MKPPSGQPQQGAMFNIKPAASHQWPRGYTPDRLHETQDALGKMRVPNSAGPARAGLARYIVTAGVARSTADLGDPKKFPTVALTMPSGGSKAGYYRHPVEGKRGNGHISIVAGRADTTVHTAIHEIGHHTDFQADPDAFRAKNKERVAFSTGGGARMTASPSLEGYAEGFAAAHYVPDARGFPGPKGKPRVEAFSSDQMRGYDRPFAHNAGFRENFQRAGGNPRRINTKGAQAKLAQPKAPTAEQGRLW